MRSDGPRARSFQARLSGQSWRALPDGFGGTRFTKPPLTCAADSHFICQRGRRPRDPVRLRTNAGKLLRNNRMLHRAWLGTAAVLRNEISGGVRASFGRRQKRAVSFSLPWITISPARKSVGRFHVRRNDTHRPVIGSLRNSGKQILLEQV